MPALGPGGTVPAGRVNGSPETGDEEPAEAPSEDGASGETRPFDAAEAAAATGAAAPSAPAATLPARGRGRGCGERRRSGPATAAETGSEAAGPVPRATPRSASASAPSRCRWARRRPPRPRAAPAAVDAARRHPRRAARPPRWRPLGRHDRPARRPRRADPRRRRLHRLAAARRRRRPGPAEPGRRAAGRDRRTQLERAGSGRHSGGSASTPPKGGRTSRSQRHHLHRPAGRLADEVAGSATSRRHRDEHARPGHRADRLSAGRLPQPAAARRVAEALSIVSARALAPQNRPRWRPGGTSWCSAGADQRPRRRR